MVNLILDKVGYKENNIINKTILEPCFGNGAFLLVIVSRLIEECLKLNMNTSEIKQQLEQNIYGIEIDTDLYLITLNKLDLLVAKYDIFNVSWKLVNDNTLLYKFKTKFDFICGNPPYVIINNKSRDYFKISKSLMFSEGLTDLYVLFFGIGINLLKNNGSLAYITPNSYFKNLSQFKFREYLTVNNLVDEIIDFKDIPIFKSVSTCTAITIIRKNKSNTLLKYTPYLEEEILINTENMLNNSNYHIWNFGTLKEMDFLLKVSMRKHKLGDICTVQSSLTTNRNYIYISKIKPVNSTEFDNKLVLFNDFLVEKAILKKVIKSTSYRGQDINEYILFPYLYDDDKEIYYPMEEIYLKKIYPYAYKYLLEHKVELQKRNMPCAYSWFEFARNQGFKNINKNKIIFRDMIKKDIENIDIYSIGKTFVYSGIYITEKKKGDIDLIQEVIKSQDFYNYCILLGKDARGGYKKITSKIIENYRFN